MNFKAEDFIEETRKKYEKVFTEKEKQYEEFHFKYKESDSQSEKFLFENFLAISNMTSSGHFSIVSNTIGNIQKINKLLTMSEDRCYEIEGANGYNIEIINKNGYLHVRPSSHYNDGVDFIVQNIKTKEQLDIIAKFFKQKNFVGTIEQSLDLKMSEYFIMGSDIKFYIWFHNNIVYISGIPLK